MFSHRSIVVRKLPLFIIGTCLLGFPIYAWFTIFPHFLVTLFADPLDTIAPGINLTSTITVVGGGYGLLSCCWLIARIERYSSQKIPFPIQAGLLALTVISTKMAVDVIGYGYFEVLISLAFLGPAMCVLFCLGLIKAFRRELSTASGKQNALRY